MYVLVDDDDDEDPCYLIIVIIKYQICIALISNKCSEALLSHVIVHNSAIIMIRLKLLVDCYNVSPTNTVPFVHQVITVSTCGCTTL